MQPNPDSMVARDRRRPTARPSARVVLCKKLVADPGLRRVLHQLRQPQGRTSSRPTRASPPCSTGTRSAARCGSRVASCARPPPESDEYFASRALDSRIGAWASLQSQPLDSRATLLKRVAIEAARHGTDVPRPPHWGGYRFWPESVELWCEGAFRVHDRARWTRTLRAAGDDGFAPGPWQATRLYP